MSEPRFRVARMYTFEAAHHLRLYHGGPESHHGHSWRLEICLHGTRDSEGMVVDFLAIDEIVQKQVLQPLDHSDLNERFEQSTSENIALWIWDQLFESLLLEEVRLWETASGWVSYRGETLPERSPSEPPIRSSMS